MLFRPLEKKFLFGIPLPLTPGIIPRQRSDLARSIARMVSRELITEEALKTHLASASFNTSVVKTVDKALCGFLDMPVTGLFHTSASQTGTAFSPVKHLVEKTITDRAFSHAMSYLVDGLVRSININIPVGNLAGILEYFLKNTEDTAGIMRKLLMRVARGDLTLSSLLSADFLDTFEDFICRGLPLVGDKVAEFMTKPTIRKELEQKGVQFMRDVFRKFNGIQRFFITAGQYDITLETNMGEIISDLVRHIQTLFSDPEKSRNIARAIRHSVEEKKDAHISGFLTEERIDKIAVAAGSVLSLLRPVDFLKMMSRSRDVIHSASLTAYLSREHIEECLYHICLSLMGKDGGRPFMDFRFDGSILSGAMKDKTLALLIPHPDAARLELSGYLSSRLLTLVETKSKDIIDALDVYTLVENKINSLDIASVERLLLQVIEKHLKWINLFGAILGGLIGAVQILLKTAGF